MEEYYTIPLSKWMFIMSLILFFLVTFYILIALMAFGFMNGLVIYELLALLIPLISYLKLKCSKYYYNNEKLIVETGIFRKDQFIIPLYRIVNINAQDNIFGFGTIWVNDKGQTIILKNVLHSKSEMLKLIEKWECAKKENVRNEVI